MTDIVYTDYYVKHMYYTRHTTLFLQKNTGGNVFAALQYFIA